MIGRRYERAGSDDRAQALAAPVMRISLAVSLLLTCAGAARAEDPRVPTEATPQELHGVFRLDTGVVLPYPLDNLFRGWVECTGRGHHKAIDIGGVGPDGGLGSVVRAMGRGKVTQIGMPADDPARFGTPLEGVDVVTRGRHRLPASKDLPGYGTVHFFTRDYGRHRSGGVVSIRITEGVLAGHEVHYLHLAAARPGLTVGDTVEAGDELGLLGGTAVLDAPPHLHLSIDSPEGKELDVGRIFGIGATRVPCRADDGLRTAIRARYTKAARILMTALRTERARSPDVQPPVAVCGPHVIEGDFDDGEVSAHRFVVAPPEGGDLTAFTLSLERVAGKHWSPRLQIEDLNGTPLYTGTLSRPQARRRFAFDSRASGKRGTAVVGVTPKKVEGLAVKIMAWPTHKRALKGATWRFTFDRPCPITPTSATPPDPLDSPSPR